MSAHNDIVTLQRRIDHLTRAASRIRDQLADLHSSAWERTNNGSGDKVRTSTIDHVPPVADLAPPARRLWRETELILERAEAALVGMERRVTGYFMVSAVVEATRGSLHSVAENADLHAARNRRKARGEFTPARLLDQPPHPGKGR